MLGIERKRDGTWKKGIHLKRKRTMGDIRGVGSITENYDDN